MASGKITGPRPGTPAGRIPGAEAGRAGSDTARAHRQAGSVTTSHWEAGVTHNERRPDRPPVMTDVARLAGVSHQTVSRVLNDHPNVRARTRESVLAAINELEPDAALHRFQPVPHVRPGETFRRLRRQPETVRDMRFLRARGLFGTAVPFCHRLRTGGCATD